MDTGQSLPIKHRDQNLLTYYVHFLKMKLFLSGPVGSWSLSWPRSLQLGADKQREAAACHRALQRTGNKKGFLVSS